MKSLHSREILKTINTSSFISKHLIFKFFSLFLLLLCCCSFCSLFQQNNHQHNNIHSFSGQSFPVETSYNCLFWVFRFFTSIFHLQIMFCLGKIIPELFMQMQHNKKLLTDIFKLKIEIYLVIKIIC